MKIVAVSMRIDAHPEREEIRDALDQRLIAFIHACNGLAVPVPNHLVLTDALIDWLNSVKPMAIVLSGGNNIGEYPARDSTEKQLLDYAEKNDLPLLGICRGMQMIGVHTGSILKSVSDHVQGQHHLAGVISGKANSYHNYSLATLSPEFTVLAKSEDGEIEAIRHNTLPWEGWMWHPEREDIFQSRDIDRLNALLA